MQDEIYQIYLSGITGQEGNVDYDNANTDVIVILNNGQKYLGAFFTYLNIEEIARENKQTGEKLFGKYFWAKNLVLVDRCDLKSIEAVVKNLMEEGDFKEVFYRIF